MTDEQADTLIALMASGSTHVDGLPDAGLAQLHTDLKAVALPYAQCEQIISAMVLAQVRGRPLPKAGDFLTAIRNEIHRGRATQATGSSPTSWDAGLRCQLARMHENAVKNGPVGALRALIHAGRIDEQQMRAIIADTEEHCGERREFSARNPFSDDEAGSWISLDQPRAQQHINALVFEAVHRQGLDPMSVVNDWRRRNGYEVSKPSPTTYTANSAGAAA